MYVPVCLTVRRRHASNTSKLMTVGSCGFQHQVRTQGLRAVLVTEPTISQGSPCFLSGGRNYSQYSYCLPTEGWPDLSWPGWLVNHQDAGRSKYGSAGILYDTAKS